MGCCIGESLDVDLLSVLLLIMVSGLAFLPVS